MARPQLLLQGRVHDPDRVSLRKALRAAIFTPSLFALGGFALDSPTMGLFASFGSFCLIAMTDLGGERWRMARGYVVITAGGLVLVAVGTAVAPSVVAAALGMAVVAFWARLIAVLGGYFAAAGPALTLPFVLAVALPTDGSPLSQRLLGWGLGGLAATLGGVALWPARERPNLVDSLAVTCQALGALLDGLAAGVGPAGLADVDARAATALAETERRFRSSARRPAGPTPRERAIVRSIGHTGWILDLARLTAASGPLDPADAELLRASATEVRGCAAALRGDGPVALEPALAARAGHLDQLRAAVRVAGRGTDDDARRAAARLEHGFAARATSFAVLWLGVDIAVIRGDEVAREAASTVEADDPSTRAELGRAWASLRNQLRPDAVWFRDAMRTGIALGLAIAVAVGSGLPHAFWVALGTLSVLRGNAMSTGYTVLQSLLGTLAGFVLSVPLITLAGDSWALWVALPVLVFLTAYTPTAVHFVVGQACFTLFVVVLFNLLEPEGWRTGLLRLGDIALGAAVALGVSLVFWPRGASAQVRDATTASIASGGRYVAAAVTAHFAGAGEPAADGTVERARHDALAAQRRASEALIGFLGERGRRRLPKEVAGQLLTVGAVVDLAGEAVRSMAAVDRPDPSGGALGAQLTDEARVLVDRLRLAGTSAAPAAADGWVARDIDALAACIDGLDEREGTDGAESVVLASWIASWLHHVGQLGDRAEMLAGQAQIATAQHWWRTAPR